jgi:hypothetical protein
MKVAAPLVLFMLGSVPPALAQMAKDVTTPKDMPAMLVSLLSVRPDCSLGTADIPVVQQRPKHGAVTLAATMLDVPSTGDCPARRASVIVVVYAPAIGFTGTDNVAIDFSDAGKPPLRYRVSVIPGDEGLPLWRQSTFERSAAKSDGRDVLKPSSDFGSVRSG